uniref:BAG family molecular chaperone regulator 1 n=1 Tax=Magallana gigas TaxID=29159 RepID=K1QEK1_MAGGI
MAAAKAKNMKLQVKHGSKVHEVRLQAEQGNVLTVHDLVKKINEVTEIPPANQKILYKGKTLNKDLDVFLTDTGLTDNAKVMLLGKKLIKKISSCRVRKRPEFKGKFGNYFGSAMF